MKLTPDPLIIRRAEGVFLETADGKRIVDAIGSWWTCIHGHNHPYINEAISKQLRELEHVMYAGFTHEPALRLSERLSQSTAHALPRAFFSDNGSTAVEIALKMAFQFFVNAGRPEKKRFAMIGGGYHGDTIGTMSVGSRSVFHKMYLPLLFEVHTLEQPRCERSAWSDETMVRAALAPALRSLEDTLKKHAGELCGLVLEPLLQGAAGMNMYPPLYLQEARRLCDGYDVFLIADEVFTGCGRTGSFYGFEQAGVWPDVMALSKGLPSGYLPFAATLASERIYNGFYSDDRLHTLFHGHSMTGNPLGCAAANASLDIFESEGSLAAVAELERQHQRLLTQLAAALPKGSVREVRALGSVAALELAAQTEYTSDFGWRIWQGCIERGVLLRPIGGVVYLAPPYSISLPELEQVYGTLAEVLVAELASR